MLAEDTQASTVLQLCLYSDLLESVQGTAPEHFHVVTPRTGGGFATQTYRLDEHAAYYRHVKKRLDEWEAGDTYPDRVGHCDVCRWWQSCDARRRADDSLWIVAGLNRGQYTDFRTGGIDTLTHLAGVATLPRPRRGAPATLKRIQLQAQQQLHGRVTGRPSHVLLEPERGRGLERLPEPTTGDLFFDIEGDHLGVTEVSEFLFGISWVEGGASRYRGWWATTPQDERAAFEAVMGFLADHLERHPAAHIYHFAAYEPAALKRLMGRHASCEAALDRMLRAERFVDLCAVVRQVLRASVESYSLKDLEALHSFRRLVDLRTAGAALRAVRVALATGQFDAIHADVRRSVEAYNREDCESTRSLRDWLERLRAEAIAAGVTLARPTPRSGEANEERQERSAEIEALMTGLLDSLPPVGRDPEQQARWILAHTLDYHRREHNVSWWEDFRLGSLSSEESIDEKAAIGGLELVSTVGHTKQKLPIQRYRYPPQHHEFDSGDEVRCANPAAVGETTGEDTFPTLTLGKVESQSRDDFTIDIRKTKKTADLHPVATFGHDLVRADPKPEALKALGESVVRDGFNGARTHAAASALLRRERPVGGLTARPGETPVERACRVVRQLDGGVIGIQGPPGTGKTYVAARMIRTLVSAGRRVGITATSHKVIRNLLDRVADDVDGPPIRCLHKVGTVAPTAGPVLETTDNAAVEKALGTGNVDVVGGTAWLWARSSLRDAVDVLFVDEAGQMSLADVLASSLAARSIVLVGDPRQLDQPRQGSHPDGTDVAALAHLFGDAVTVGDDDGIFLGETWRMAPALTSFTSEQFYERRLTSRPGNELQRLVGDSLIADGGSGLWYVEVDHDGNQSSSIEEAAAVARICAELLQRGTTWRDREGVVRPLGGEDILVVAPYNAHVGVLDNALAGTSVRVGTVDKFQGQEAAVAIYAMGTSSPEDAPRGMEFLYSANRFNVATSRARCASILVASPRLMTPECRTPRQVRLANSFCRFVELARRA